MFHFKQPNFKETKSTTLPRILKDQMLTTTTTNPSCQPPQPPRNGQQFSASSNNPGHFRGFSSTTGADHDPYAQQQEGHTRNTGLSTSFTPPYSFDLKDYELFFIEFKRHNNNPDPNQ